MNSIKIDQLIRSHRKTIGLQITNDARLIVRAPFYASEDYIYKLLGKKEAWIRSKLDYFKERQNKVLARRFEPGEEFLFLGQAYPLVVVENLPKAVVLDGSLMIAAVALGNARDHLENWYRAHALAYISEKTQYYAQLAGGLRYESVRINGATTRWGSCGYTNGLNFTWRLIMAPERVVDYVIIHELMHLKQKNHSRKFWAEVGLMRPDYKEDERWLRKNGHLLSWGSV